MRAPAFVGDLGASALGAYAEARALFQLFVRTLYYTFRGRRERGAVVREMYAIGNRSLGFVTMTLGTLGVIITYQAGVQTARVIPDYTMLGGMFLQVLVRDLAA